jgi:hypothetical protein
MLEGWDAAWPIGYSISGLSGGSGGEWSDVKCCERHDGG